MSNIYFMCENCGTETNGITFVNGMKFCAKCYHQIFGKDNQQNEIQLLKQLVEKQNKIDEISKEFVQAVHAVYDWRVLCAEKDKEIEKLKQQYTILDNENGKLTTELIMGKYKKAQKEISFGMQLAIQELEKVKEWLEPKYFDYEQINYLTRIIDNQIKKIKGEKDVKD